MTRLLGQSENMIKALRWYRKTLYWTSVAKCKSLRALTRLRTLWTNQIRWAGRKEAIRREIWRIVKRLGGKRSNE